MAMNCCEDGYTEQWANQRELFNKSQLIILQLCKMKNYKGKMHT